MWSKYVTRRLAVQVAQAWNFGWGKAMEKVYGISVKNTLVFRDNKKTEYYVDAKQHQAYVLGLYKLLKKESFLKNFHQYVQNILEGILSRVSQELSRVDLRDASSQDLLKIYTKLILPNVEQFYIRMWTVFNIGEPLANVVKAQLEEILDDKKAVTEKLLKLSSPLEPNDVLHERMDILKIAIKKKELSKIQLDNAFKKHTKKYQHIPMFDFDHEPYSEHYFFKQLSNVKNPKKELEDMESIFKGRRQEFNKIVSEVKPDKKFKSLLEFLKDNVFLRDYRDMLRQKLNLQLRYFYEEIGTRLGLDVAEVAVLTNDEIIKYLKNKKKFPKSVVKQRASYYLLVQKENKVAIYSGVEAFKKFKQEVKDSKGKPSGTLTGVIGSSGIARGRVRVVFTNRDLYKLKKGDIIVTSMTRQDFVPFLGLVRAIITDEGGVTAHAAIIARELKIPCILNTKIATKVFKDGDMVGVDANKGIVRKI